MSPADQVYDKADESGQSGYLGSQMQLLGPDLSDEDSGDDHKLIGDITDSAAQAKVALRRAQQRLMGFSTVSPQEQSMDTAAAWLAPTRTGNFGDTIANVARSRADQLAQSRELGQVGAQADIGLQEKLSGIDQGVLGAKLRLAQMQQERQLARQKMAAEAPTIAADVADKSADAALKGAEAKNPSLFHPGFGGAALDPTHQQMLSALEDAGVIDPQHVSRYNASPAALEAAYNTWKNNQGFTGTAHQTIAASEKDFLSNSTQSTGGKLSRGNAVMNHIEAFRDLANALKNGDVRLWNSASAAMGKQFGDPNPQNLQLAAHFVGGEATSYLSASGGTKDDRDVVERVFSVANSPDQAAGAADTAEHFMAGQFDALRQKYRSRPDKPMNFSERFLTPESQAALSRFDAARAARQQSQGNSIPPEAAKQLKDGFVTTFGNGQKWTLRNGQPVQVQ